MISAIVTDIEGTTSSIDFVHQSLFPYARKHMRAFLRANAGSVEVQQLLHDVEREAGEELTLDAAAAVLDRWMAQDQKITPLKVLQGMIWKTGYENGELEGHVYPDTPEYLRAWFDAGIRLYVYSSGSVEAQKLIFGHTAYGDLTPMFSGYFDTRIGGKREPPAYQKIIGEIGAAADATLFLSDVGEELDAAREVGLRTCQLLRDDKARRWPAHAGAHDFSEVALS